MTSEALRESWTVSKAKRLFFSNDLWQTRRWQQKRMFRAKCQPSQPRTRRGSRVNGLQMKLMFVRNNSSYRFFTVHCTEPPTTAPKLEGLNPPTYQYEHPIWGLALLALLLPSSPLPAFILGDGLILGGNGPGHSFTLTCPSRVEAGGKLTKEHVSNNPAALSGASMGVRCSCSIR